MDVRQFAFLARQPSAALKTREHFWGMPKRGLAFILANAMFWQPLWAQAEGIVVSAPGTSLGQAGNGVPIVNIATPNGSGLSHNQFHDYNVGQQGVILNNATDRTQSTQLGGIIVGNPNLKGVAAQTILNEVNGGSPSQLRGYTEVAGQSAHVIVANPYGISCNGCGFINTPKATLTTGKPVIENGQLSRYQVDQGQVTIEGATLNANNVDRFEIITRSAKINAEIQAKNLSIVTGRNDVDARTLNATARADDGSAKPELAIDSSALGGMYAGAIKLVGTEAGVGVRLAGNLAASGGDIQIDANGHLSMVQAAAGAAVKVKAASLDAQGPVYAGSTLDMQSRGDLNNQKNLAARDSINLSAGGQLSNSGIIEAGVNADNSRNAGGDLTVNAQTLNNNGNSLVASRNLTVTTAQALNNQGGTLSAKQSANIRAGTLDNQNKGRVLSSGSLNLNANQLLNNQGGLVSSNGELVANLAGLGNAGAEISSLARVTLNVASLDNVAGLIAAGSALNINASGVFNNQGGRLSAQQDLQLVAASLNNSQQGSIISQGALGLTTQGTLDNHQAGRIQSTGNALISSASLNNQGGKLAARDISLQVADLDNRQGQVIGDGSLTLNSRGAINNATGSMTSGQLLNVQGASLDNTQGTLLSSAGLTAKIAGQLLNQAGLLSANALLTLDSASLDNQLKGRIVSKAGANLNTLGVLDNRGGSVSAGGALTLNANRVDNRQGGSLSAAQGVNLGIDNLDNQGGNVSSQGYLKLTGTTLNNSHDGKLLANGDIDLTLGQLDNQLNGQLSGQAGVQVKAAQLNNGQGGNLYAKGKLDLDLSGQLLNARGTLKGDGAMLLKAGSLNNDAGQLSSVKGLQLTSLGTLSNLGGSLTSGDTLDLVSGQLNNGAAGSISSAKALTASVSGLDQQGGKLFSSTGLSLDLNNGQLNNQDGLINATGLLLLKNLKGVSNQDGEISSDQGFTLAAQTLDNTDGTIGSEQALVLRVERTLNNLRGLVSANGLKVHAASIDNTEGTMGSDSDLSLSVEEALTNLNGTLSSAGLSSLKAASLNNTEGQLTGDLGLSIDLSGALNNQGGMLGSGKALTLNAGSLDNRAEGVLLAVDGSLTGTVVGAFDNRELGKLRAAGGIELTTGSLDNRGGSLSGKDRLTLRSDLADNRGGLIQADKDLKLLVGQLDNRDKGALSGKAAIDYEGSRLDNSGGLLSAVGPVTLKAQEVTNSKGRIASQVDLTATVDTLNQQGGALVAQGSLLLTGKALDNRNGGLVGSTNALTLNVDQVDNRAGEISSTENSLSYTGLRLDNSDGGKLLSATDLQLTVAQLINQSKGRLFAKGSAGLTGTRLDNSSGSFSGLKGLDIRLDGALLNNAGVLSSEAGLTLNVATLDNTKGKLGSAGALSLTSLGALLNQGGSIVTDQGLTLASSSLDNSQSGVINGKGATHVTTGLLNNSQGGHLTSDDTLDLNATQVDNGASGRIASEKALTANITGLDQQGGELFSKTQLNLDLNNGRLDNRKGLINGPVLVLNNLKDVANQNGEISSAQAFMLAAQNLDNSAGKLLSKQGLTLRIAQALNNQNGLISATSLNSRSASLDNSHGLISSRGEVDLGVTQAFTNQGGTLIGDGAVLLAANSLDNRDGSVAGKADVTATINTLDNQNGQFIASGALGLTGAVLDNRLSGLVGATKALKLEVGSIDNRGGELSSSADIGLTGKRLDNSDSGQIIAAMGLTMTLDQVLNRNQGLINGKSGLTLDGQTLDNTAGQLRSGQDVRLGLGGDLTNNQGLISSEGKLDLTSANLSNTAGSLSSAGALKVKASAALGNQGGQLVSDSSIELSSASLDNRQQGVISSKGSMGVTTGAFDNSQNGRLNSGDSLTLATGQVTNRSGGVIGSSKALTASVTGLDQMGGKLFSNTSLTLDLNQGQLNNQTGLINAPSLELRNLKGINNQGGEVSSAQAFSLTADSLDNSNGKLLSNQTLTLRVNQALTNLKGQIAAAALDVRADSLDNAEGSVSSRSDLNLAVAGLLSNQNKGLINATQNLTLSSADLNNQGGTLLGGSAVTLNAMALNNSANGLINSQGSLALTASSLNSSNGGEVSAKGDITLNLGALTQNGGRLLGDSGVRLDLANTDLDNRNGLLIAKGPLSISRLRDLNNQNGEISSSLSTNLVGRVLNNNGGKLISNNQLGLTGETLLNQGGLISGWQGLTVSGGSLDNRNTGTLSSRSGDLNANISGALLNSSAGALVSQKALNVSAASLDNSAGILSSGAGQQLTVGGLLNNTQGGSIDSGAALTMQAMTLNNAGTVSAQQALGFTGTTLDNTGGSLVSNGAVNLDLLGSLSNTNGKLASGGPLVISRSSQINNQGGQLVSQGLMSVLTGGLDNRNRGTVAANGNLLTKVSGAVQNNGDGLIYSQNGTLELSAASLGNAKGTLQSQGAMDLAVAGDIDNQSGRLLAQNGDLKVSATNLDNRGGTLASLKGALEARIVGVLKNGYDLNNNRQGGIAQAERLNLSVLGGIDNYGGRISAQSGDALITTANFDNRNGGLYAKGLVKVSGNNFDNSGDNDGQIAGNRIDLSLNGHLNNRMGIIESDSSLSVRAASLDNQTGQLRALGAGGKTDFQIGGLFDNRNGKLESANSDLTVNAASFQNQGGSLLHVGNGTFDISTANVTNAGGSLVTRGGLTLAADSWTNSSVIQAGRLTVNVNNLIQTGGGQLLATTSLVGNGGNWTNDGLIASDGTASLTLGGSYSGNGRYSSLGSLGLTAASMNLGSAGSVAGGGNSTIRIGGPLTNAGRLTSNAGLTVEAGSIVNSGTLGAAQNLDLKTPSLLNDRGLIFSGADMTLGVGNFTNQNGDLYGLGNVSIGGYGGAARAAGIYNVSGSMESGGAFALNADVFQNRTDGAVASGSRKLVSGFIANICNDCRGGSYTFTLAAREVYESVDNDTSASALLTAGKDLVFQGGTFLNSKSTVNAGGNINITADNLQNIGAQNGTIERTRLYKVYGMGSGATGQFFSDVLTPYNQRNNPDFPYEYYLDLEDNIHKAIPKSARIRQGGQSGELYHVVSLKDSETGRVVSGLFGYNIVLTGLKYGFENTTSSQYDPNNLLELPSQLSQHTLLSDVEIAKDSSGAVSTSGSRNAVIQAGGNVSITATQDLQNSVIHQDYSAAGGTNKVADTRASGTGTTVVRLNSQLPPDLAQQQVNPLSLPGFTLPTGQNGLFRLSGQGGSAQQATQANIGPQNWTMGSASVSSAQRQQNLPDIQARSFQIDDVAQVASSDRQLTRVTRQATDSNLSASAIDVSAPADNGGTLALSGHEGNAGAITQVGAVHVEEASQSAVATGPDLSVPTLPLNPRDPLASVTSPGVGNVPTGAVPAVANPVVATPVASQAVARVQGVPDTSFKPNPQKYLIETNPVLTDLKQFMSSDYLLAGLGYDPDISAKRLGDGLYEQRLVQQAITARTGQAFLAGQNSNEAQFKYLMNNAIASKDQLNLSVGVTLTSQQVAALTHDIVWLEEHEVNGEKVLVPVLYMAQANDRLGPTGALIAGNDVSLIAGQNLDNVGTLRATHNLSATAGKDLVNSGLIQAGNRLDLLAGNNITNKAGGIIAGRDVTMNAISGDVLNERSVTSVDSVVRGYSHKDYANSAARIEAANDMVISAGRDITNPGSVLQSGRDMSLSAGRDANIVSTELNSSLALGKNHYSSAITQIGSEVSAGRDLTVKAGRDINAIASEIEAKRNIAMAATENLTLSSAADEQHSYEKTKKVTRQEDHVSQVATTLSAGGDVDLSAGKDMALISSRITAGDEAYLVAGDNLELLAAQDSDYSLYDKKKKGSWGSKQTKRDEVTKITHVGSDISTGGDLTLVSGGDQKYQAAKLESGSDLTLASGGEITFEGVKDLHQESHEKTNNNAAWVSSKGKGNTDETLRQTQMLAAGDVVIKAVDGLKIDVKQVDQQTVSQSIDAMVKADPQLAWLKQAEARGDVDWRQVKEIHESFKYSNSGLGPASQIIIAIVMAAVVGPMAAGAMGGATGGAVAAGTISSTTAGGLSAAAGAVAAGAATNATVSVINNRGNLGAVFKDVTSSDAMKGYVISGVTAGLTAAYFDGWTGTETNTSIGKVIVPPSLSTWSGVGQFAANQTLQSGTSMLLGKALGQGGSASDALKGALFNTLAAASFNLVGDYTKGVLADGSLPKIAVHAMVGGLLAKATGGDFKTGALAAGANEALVTHLDKLVGGNENLLTMSSQIVGVLAAAAQTDADAAKMEKGSWVAKNSTQYNFLGDHSAAERDRARKEFEKDRGIDSAKKLVTLEGADQRSDNLLAAYRKDPGSLSKDQLSELTAYLQVYAYEQIPVKGEQQVKADLANLLQNGPTPTTDFSYAGTTEAKNAYADAARAELGWAEQVFWSRDKSANELTYRDAQGALRINNEQQGLANIGGPAIYGLSGPLGVTIRIAATANGVLQAGYGANQALNGDTWNAVGNIVFGLLGATSMGVPSTKLPNSSGISASVVEKPYPISSLMNSETVGLFDRAVLHVPVKDKLSEQATQELLNAIYAFPSNTQASKVATMISAYDPVSGKIAVGSSNGRITADSLDVRTVNYVEGQLGVKIGELTDLCRNSAGACAEVSAVDKLVRLGVNPAGVKFTDAVRPKTVRDEGGITPKAIIGTCPNCKATWPEKN
ncbi:filamentous hemagglutinin N-terminal domain-containing protein [Pseudomonas chlororaphis]|uniref:two-partner secretion domain-containing protein n=1 Tax=Pseudomonas chlororaphis TaxID=587753 RepID=UPI000F6FF026|nr:filamentous hemagglutinin N-terminal domain-containing protein [Pseudomonas chlororaphis]AZD80697.1 Putative large exoprotein, ShlA/HecA/FhaA family [Pseudomonas chlororaphis subsp. aurantiaca]